MLYSKLFGRSLREVSDEVRSRGHEYLLRAGFIRESSAGRFYMLPLGIRVQERVCRVIRDEIEQLGSQQISVPLLHPRELWEETRRTESVSFELMQVKDRSGRGFVLGGTAEEMVVALVRQFALSERDLPICLYQFSSKFRDELRARGGLLRTREFLMKDGYSFHTDRADFEQFYRRVGERYQRIFERLGLDAKLVAASNGYMGGDYAHELIVEHPIGESRYLVSEDGRYAAHEDVATFEREIMNADERVAEMRVQAAPRGVSIEEGMRLYGAPAWRQIKSLIYITDRNERVLVSLRGDLSVSEDKLLRALGCSAIRLATNEEVRECGSLVGFVSPVGSTLRRVGDYSLSTVRNFITGANQFERDTINVNYGRDFTVELLADIAVAQDGHKTVEGGSTLRERRGIEVGNIFQLGCWYSERMKGAAFTNSNGEKVPFYMGCYGLGVGRTIAAIAELHHDQVGLLWPQAAAPYAVHLIQLGSDPQVARYAQEIYQELAGAGIETLYDERELSAGVKFADADLLGIRVRIVVSARVMKSGQVELQSYRADEKQDCAREQLSQRVRGMLG